MSKNPNLVMRDEIMQLRAINAELRERLNCSYCWEHRDDLMMPPHTASVNCESGNRNHCTCSICF